MIEYRLNYAEYNALKDTYKAELEKYKQAYEKASDALTSIATSGDLDSKFYAANILKDCEAIIGDKE